MAEVTVLGGYKKGKKNIFRYIFQEFQRGSLLLLKIMWIKF